jgi:hypothetical protein
MDNSGYLYSPPFLPTPDRFIELFDKQNIRIQLTKFDPYHCTDGSHYCEKCCRTASYQCLAVDTRTTLYFCYECVHRSDRNVKSIEGCVRSLKRIKYQQAHPPTHSKCENREYHRTNPWDDDGINKHDAIEDITFRNITASLCHDCIWNHEHDYKLDIFSKPNECDRCYQFADWRVAERRVRPALYCDKHLRERTFYERLPQISPIDSKSAQPLPLPLPLPLPVGWWICETGCLVEDSPNLEIGRNSNYLICPKCGARLFECAFDEELIIRIALQKNDW